MIDAVSPDELAYVDVHSREYGIQGRLIVPRPGTQPVIALRPVSTWNGRLSAEDPKMPEAGGFGPGPGSSGDPNAEPQATGYVETTTDDEGRFTLAPIAAGRLRLDLKPPGELPVVVDLPDPWSVREGREDTLVRFPLARPSPSPAWSWNEGPASPCRASRSR